MLAIGRALMTNPRLLILDEATEGLAPLIRAEIYRSIERLKAAGLSILIIDKDVKALTRIADTHYVLEKGPRRLERDIRAARGGDRRPAPLPGSLTDHAPTRGPGAAFHTPAAPCNFDTRSGRCPRTDQSTRAAPTRSLRG